MRIVLSIFALVLSLAACADDPVTVPEFKEGVHYQRLEDPVRTRDKSKIEVTEVFWYGCGHCFHFEPMIHQWADKQADDVDFSQSPAMWNYTMAIHARAFYVARALNVLDKVHQPLFNALNLERKSLASRESLAEFFASLGVDKDQFSKAYDSFGVVSQVKQADARARSYKITGTPELVIDGTYRVSSRLAGSQANMLKVTDFLIAKIRQQRG